MPLRIGSNFLFSTNPYCRQCIITKLFKKLLVLKRNWGVVDRQGFG